MAVGEGPRERASQTARRKIIYEELHPETRQGAVGRGGYEKGGQDVHSFSEVTAVATGKDERTVRRDAERGTKVIGEVIDMITGTSQDPLLDIASSLDRIRCQQGRNNQQRWR